MKKGKGLWKFNNPLIKNKDCVLKPKHFIQKRIQFLNANSRFCDQMK